MDVKYFQEKNVFDHPTTKKEAKKRVSHNIDVPFADPQ